MKQCLNSLNMSSLQYEVPFSLYKLLQMWTIVLAFSPAMSGYHWNTSTNRNHLEYNVEVNPEFVDISIREKHATVGQTLLLPCTVRNLGDKVVSWIRTKDLHILTSGVHMFSSDSRFEPVHTASSGDFWGLRIRGAQISDTGQYECQVNTDPKMSLAIKLTVEQFAGVGGLAISNSKWVSQALIKGPSELYVPNGSPVTFTCEISPLSVASLQSGAHGLFFATKPRVRWLHNGQELTVQAYPSNVTIDSVYRESDLRIISTLRLGSVTWKDSGHYTCMQPSTKADTVRLQVVEGEHSEAMQGDFPVSSSSSKHTNIIIKLVFIYFLLY